MSGVFFTCFLVDGRYHTVYERVCARIPSKSCLPHFTCMVHHASHFTYLYMPSICPLCAHTSVLSSPL
jgi:hypothetical protein